MVVPPRSQRGADFHLGPAGVTVQQRQLSFEELPDEVGVTDIYEFNRFCPIERPSCGGIPRLCTW